VSAFTLTGVCKTFAGRRGSAVIALDQVTMQVGRGEVVAVIGESGAGKSSLARVVLGLVSPDRGQVEVLGQDLAELRGAELRRLRRRATAVFQEPYDSLDPRMTVRQIISEPLLVHFPGVRQADRLDVVIAALRSVSLDPGLASRYPHELSGGQQQRVSLARAFVTLPDLVVLDEPTSALDASTRGQVIDVLRGLQARRGVSLLLVTHDIGTVRRLADRVVVMYRGRIVESGPAAAVLGEPRHPYSQLLLSAELTVTSATARPPATGTSQAEDDAEVPVTLADQDDGPAGSAACVFRARCPLGDQDCDAARVELRPLTDSHQVACVKGPRVVNP
jgi:oligopeptide/dipeptide ABC transporter ATP-binding protein